MPVSVMSQSYPSEEPPLEPPPLEALVFDDGVPLESPRHRQQMNVLVDSLELAWVERRDFYVGGNMFFYYSEVQSRRNDFRGPDVFVALGVERRERKGWVVWLEGGKTPDVIIELTSPSTAAIDHGEKKKLYERLKIGEYFIYDPFEGTLEGFELDAVRRCYREKVLDERGRLACVQLGLTLGVVPSRLWETEAPWLRWLDEQGAVLLHPLEAALREVAKAERAEALADQAEERADQAEARARRAEERLAEYDRRSGPGR